MEIMNFSGQICQLNLGLCSFENGTKIHYTTRKCTGVKLIAKFYTSYQDISTSFFFYLENMKGINEVNLHKCWSVGELRSESSFDGGGSNSCNYKSFGLFVKCHNKSC